MPKAALGTSIAVAGLLRERRTALGLSLREVERRTRRAGNLIPFSTLAKIEQGKLDPGLKRLQLLLRLYELPIEVAGDLLEIEELAGERPEETDPEILRTTAVEAYQRGEIRKALACFLKLREVLAGEGIEGYERQRELQNFAGTLCSIGKYRLARRILEDLLMEDLEPGLETTVNLTMARVWSAIGSSAGTLTFAARARELAGPDDHQILAWTDHSAATGYELRRDYETAERLIRKAIDAYDRAGDPYGAGRAYGKWFRILISSDRPGEALRIARHGIRHAEEHDLPRVRVLRQLDLAEALLAAGDTDPAFETLNDALSAAIGSGDRAVQFYAHYYLWKAHQQCGDLDRAGLELNNASYFLRFVDESTDQTEEVRRFMKPEEDDSWKDLAEPPPRSSRH